MSNLHSQYLKEMGISEWAVREPIADNGQVANPQATELATAENAVANTVVLPKEPRAHWWFFGTQPQAEAKLLFQNVLRALGLSPKEWQWMSPNEDLSKLSLPESGLPVVAIAFGGPAVQKVTGERDPLMQLRETILALNTGNDDDIPVIATLDLSHFTNQAKDKALLWQDLLLAKSVLQNI